MPRSSRHRHLARLAARRQAERRRQRRRAAVTAVVVVVALIGGGVAFGTFVVGKSNSSASGTPTPSPTVSPTPSPAPGKKTGTVPAAPGPKQVACGGKRPAAATKPKPQFAGGPASVISVKKTYTAMMQTSCGTIEIRLLASKAPKTVNSFVFLARKGFFDGIHFHRIDTSLNIIQGGDPTGGGGGGPGYTIPDEATGKETYGPGVVAMAKSSSPNSGGSQFFIVYGKKGHQLDSSPSYTIFGVVVKGLNVVKRIAAVPVQNPSDISGQQPLKAIYIEKVAITVSK